uniref:Uncharacterized protein n=1 Tax=viral metagenome TaxID=1070528 RepID=A0A6M3KNV8_9ZZZZ
MNNTWKYTSKKRKKSYHKHEWEISSHEECPSCWTDDVSYCTDPRCRIYKCNNARCGLTFKVTRRGI